MKSSTTLFFLLFFASFHVCSAQHISGAMQFVNPVEQKDSNSFSLSYSTLSYFRDYEYFKNNIQTGYTLFGSWHYPRFVIQPNKWLKLEAGALIQKEFGESGHSKTSALFSVQLVQKNLRIIFGSIESNGSHQLVESIMGYDRIIERPVEEGFQVKYSSSRIRTDLWLDWEIFQQFNSNNPEKLTGGLSFDYIFSAPGKAWQVKLPVQFLIPHQGGQLDTNHSIVTTVINSAAGLSSEWKNPAEKGGIKEFKIESYYTHYRHFQQRNLYPFEKGCGFLGNIYIQSKFNIGFLATYWSGSKFIAPKGAAIYQSISSISGRENYQEPIRKLLFLNLLYDNELFPDFFIDARISPYIDLKKGYLEHSFLILFSYRNNFRIGHLKK